MPKPHPEKPHPKGAGTKLVADVSHFTNLFVASLKEQTRAKEQIANEGPEHKQVLNAALLMQLAILVKAIESRTGQALQLQPGETIVSHKHEEVSIPVPFPLENIPAKNKKAVLEIIAKAPEHEVLVYAILQQIAVWGSKVLAETK